MTDPIWPWADLHQSSDWPLLRNVSTSQTPAKGEDYPLLFKETAACEVRIEHAVQNEKILVSAILPRDVLVAT